MELNIPDKLYKCGLVAVFGVMVGLVLVFGERIAPGFRPAPDRIATSAGPVVTNLREEIRVLRLENAALLSIISENLPNHPCLDHLYGDARESEEWLLAICYPDTAMQQPSP